MFFLFLLRAPEAQPPLHPEGRHTTRPLTPMERAKTELVHELPPNVLEEGSEPSGEGGTPVVEMAPLPPDIQETAPLPEELYPAFEQFDRIFDRWLEARGVAPSEWHNPAIQNTIQVKERALSGRAPYLNFAVKNLEMIIRGAEKGDIDAQLSMVAVQRDSLKSDLRHQEQLVKERTERQQNYRTLDDLIRNARAQGTLPSNKLTEDAQAALARWHQQELAAAPNVAQVETEKELVQAVEKLMSAVVVYERIKNPQRGVA